MADLSCRMKPIRKHLPHDPPLWINPTEEAFFITVNCQPRGQNQLARMEVWDGIMDSVVFREEQGDWKWKIILAMPDHLHGIVTFPQRFHLRQLMSDWKRWLANQQGIHWQDGFFDHRLRSNESAVEKGKYIRMNPVRSGLVASPEDWPYCRDWKRGDD